MVILCYFSFIWAMTDKYHILFGWLIDRLSQLYTKVYMAKEDVVIVPEDVSHVCVHSHACIDEIVPSWSVNFHYLCCIFQFRMKTQVKL